MVKPFHTPVYQPMSDTENIMSEYDQYLKSLDKEYGTQFSVQELERTGEKKMESTNEFEEMFKAGLKESEETEDHFDDKEDELEPEDPGYDEDDVLVEEDKEDDKPYTTQDLATALTDMLNSDVMNWDNGVYEDQEQALEYIGDYLDKNDLYDTPKGISEDHWYDICEDGKYEYLEDFMINNPQYAEDIFNAAAKAFGYSNYVDYKTYVDWVEDEDDLGYDEVEEATNTGAIAHTPGKHTILTMDEDELDND